MDLIKFACSNTISASAKRQVKWFGIIAIIAIASAFLFQLDPAISDLYPPCLFHKLTGLHCPGCGSLRSLHQLLNGNFLEAVSLNPLMILFLPFFGYFFISYSLQTIQGRSLPDIFESAHGAWFVLGIILAFWVLRNIPFYPFLCLAP